MSVQATAINDNNGQVEFHEVRADTLDEARERATRVAARIDVAFQRPPLGIAYDLAEGGREVRLVDGTTLDWDEFLASKGLKDEGFAVEPSEVK
jgi:hypothetical protein